MQFYFVKNFFQIVQINPHKTDKYGSDMQTLQFWQKYEEAAHRPDNPDSEENLTNRLNNNKNY